MAINTKLTKPPTNPLRPVMMSNASPLRFTAAAGTKLAGTYSLDNVIILSRKRALQPYGFLHPRNVAGSSLRSLSKIPHCCLN